MVAVNYEYVETESKNIIPEGDNWEYWGQRTTPEESVAVWRRIANEETNEETI